jgi:hypothetical protein
LPDGKTKPANAGRAYFFPFIGLANVAVTEPTFSAAFAAFSAALFFGFRISLFERI